MSNYRQTITVTVESDEPITPQSARDGSVPGVAVGPIIVTDALVNQPTVSPLNRAKLLELLDWVGAQDARRQAGLPSEWSQGSWLKLVPGLESGPQVVVREGTQCGTSCCIAGKVALSEGARPADFEGRPVFGTEATPSTTVYEYTSLDYVIPPGETEQVFVSDFAQRVLGLNDEQATNLFRGSNDYPLIAQILGELIAEAGTKDNWVPVDKGDQDLTAPVVSEAPPEWVEGERYDGRVNPGQRVTFQGRVYRLSPTTVCQDEPSRHTDGCWTLVEAPAPAEWERKDYPRNALVTFQGRVYKMTREEYPESCSYNNPADCDACWTVQA